MRLLSLQNALLVASLALILANVRVGKRWLLTEARTKALQGEAWESIGINHLRAAVLGTVIGVAYWLLVVLLRPGMEVLVVASPNVALFIDRLTAILEIVLPFTLPVIGLALTAMCLGTYLRCRELRAELEAS